MLRLVPFGPPASDALREAIALAKRDDPLRPVTVAVPSNYAGLSLRRALGASPGGLVNAGFIVLARVAELLGSPALALAGKRPLTAPVRAEAVRAAGNSLKNPSPTLRAMMLNMIRASVRSPTNSDVAAAGREWIKAALPICKRFAVMLTRGFYIYRRVCRNERAYRR